MVTTLILAAALSVPRLERISATVSPTYQTTIRGVAEAVPPSALVAAVNLHTGHYAIVPADASGGFEATLFAPGGSSILIKTDPSGLQLRNPMEGNTVLSHELLGLGGTVLQVPDAFATNRSATLTDLSFFRTLPPWVATATLDKSTYQRGETITIDGLFTVLGAAASGQTAEVDLSIYLVGLSRADGRGTLDHNVFASTVMTPTGLPIERGISYANSHRLTHPKLTLPLQQTGDRLQTTFRITSRPIDVPDGVYRPQLQFVARGVATTAVSGPGIATRMDGAARRLENYTYGLLPPIRIGNPAPPRLLWTLLANTTSQGSRGVTAVEDRDRFAMATRIAVSPDPIVVPRVDARTGARIRYDLEPFALTVAVSNRGEPPNYPTLPFRFPSGSLLVSIRKPSGQTTVIGPAPFRQPRLHWRPVEKGNFDANHAADAFQLTTLDDRFHVTFAEDGVHEITVTGTIEDVWGNVWTGGGTYIVHVGRLLEIDSALLPGTPLEAGDAINPSLQLLPAVPADVEVRYRFARASRRDLLTELTLHAKANAHGYAALDPIAAPDAGEYRIDITATYRDEQGRFWSGARTWGGVVASRSPPIELHGLRGVDDQQSDRLAWFSRKQIGLSKDTGGHVNLAFHSGDVQWLADDHDAATLRMGIHDPGGLIPSEMLQRDCGPIEDKIAIGEAPFHSVGPGELDPHIATSMDNELWAYAYRFVERPRVRVREVIAEECVPGLYWRFDDRYGLQTGVGANGDLPNDFKFQFGGLAAYGKVLTQPVHSIYGSLFVVIPADDPLGTRVFPPFQGNGGGSSGGPLFRLKGRDIDLFFHPTAVRPGTILERGTPISFTGQIGPTLPSKVEIVVTSPSGVVRTITGVANKIGYFHQPASDFAADEVGVWRARVRVWHEGRISAGQVTVPFPTGDVLGSREGEFYFYVVDPNAPLLRVAGPSHFVQPARRPVPFTITPPAGLTEIEIHHTTTMPGFVLEEGKLAGVSYTYDATRLARDFPNLDLENGHSVTGVDTILITFALSGKDAGGTRKFFARQVVLEGEEILGADLPSRRRRARH
ncbi:MAG TPA: hypothetical protein VGQ36_26290 [Thermoanaerobaculia bacterium]|jgi:hypothetical protein|nr:hypothetical protein [Thermoanaerobaculia bacterium]